MQFKSLKYILLDLKQCFYSNRSHGGTSPSTSEAIAGMLSISQNWTPNSKNRREQHSPEEDVKNVHQDEDYG